MTEEEIRHLQQAYAELKEEAAQKDRRIEELEGLLLSARLCIEELKRRLAKDSHNRGLPMVGTESRNRNLAQKSHGSLKDNLEKLFRRGRGSTKGAMVALRHAFREGEVIFAMHIDVLETQRS